MQHHMQAKVLLGKHLFVDVYFDHDFDGIEVHEVRYKEDNIISILNSDAIDGIYDACFEYLRDLRSGTN